MNNITNMSFIKFLIEQIEQIEPTKERLSGKTSQNILSYQSMLSTLDDSHVDKHGSGWQFNYGTITGISKFKNLDVRVSKGSSEYIKLGKIKDSEKYIIAVSTNEIPKRMDIDSFFDDEDIMKQFVKCLDEYSSIEIDGDISPTNQERKESFFKKDNFEEHYDKLTDAINNKIAEYKKALEEVESSKSANVFKGASIETAKQQLKKEYIGNSEKEFLKNVFKYPEAEFVGYLEKESKDKIIRRLTDYYEQKLTD